MKNRFYALAITAIFALPVLAQQSSVKGKTLANVEITDANDNPKKLPFFGEKVIMVLYTDPDVKDVNDQLSNAVKAKKFDTAKYQGIGIANCKDTWIPDAGIRMKARQKEKDFPGSIVMLDQEQALPKAWGLGDCDETGVVIIIGKDKTVKYAKNIKTQDESKAIIAEVVKVLEAEIGK
jgi:predicted transcriptional regulator